MVLKDCKKKLQKIAAIYLSLEKKEDLKKKWMEAILKEWSKTEVLEIAKSGGHTIRKADILIKNIVSLMFLSAGV